MLQQTAKLRCLESMFNFLKSDWDRIVVAI